MKKTLLNSLAAVALLSFASNASAAISWESVPGNYEFSSSMTLLDEDYEGIILGECNVEISEANAIFNLAGNPNNNGQGLTFDQATGTLTINSAAYGDPNSSNLAFADEEGNNPYIFASREESFTSTWVWTIESDGTIFIPDFTIVNVISFSENKTEIIAKFSAAELSPLSSPVEPSPEPEPTENPFVGTFTVTGNYVDYTESAPFETEKTFTLEINAKNQVVKIAGFDISQNPLDGEVNGNVFSIISVPEQGTQQSLWLEMLNEWLLLGNSSYSDDYESTGITLTLEDGVYSLSDLSIWQYNFAHDVDEPAFNRIGYWYRMKVTKENGGAEVPPTEEVSFAGEYNVDSYLFSYVEDEGNFNGYLPLVIDEDNYVTQFAQYDLTPWVNSGYGIQGEIKDNVFTFKSWAGLILDYNYETGHYILLNGSVYGDDFVEAPVTFTYYPETDEYELSEWTIWDYDSQANVYTKLGLCWTYDVIVGEAPETIDYAGIYTVTGLHTIYTDGVEGEPFEDSFTMKIQYDGYGYWEFPEFAGYEVSPEPYYGIYGEANENELVLGPYGNVIIQTEEGGIIVNSPFEYDERYEILLLFSDDDNGIISNFGVWNVNVEGEVLGLISTWKNLSFGPYNGETGAIKGLENSNNAPAEYYTIQGVKVQNPDKGIYIIKQGDKTRKVVIR